MEDARMNGRAVHFPQKQKKIFKFIQSQKKKKTRIAKEILRKTKAGGITLSYFKMYYTDLDLDSGLNLDLA